MPVEQQVKKKKKKHGKKKKQDPVEIQKPTDSIGFDIKEDTESEDVIEVPVSYEDGSATFSGCSKTLFFAVILGKADVKQS
jgi:hypothetical protein